MQWCVVEASKPILAKASIEAIGLQVFMPECVIRVRKGRRTELVRRPLLYQYMFASFDRADPDETWKRIFSRRGVETVMSVGNVPISISDAQLEGVREEAAKYAGIREKIPLTLGQAIQIIDGALNGQRAVITAAEDGKAEIGVDLNLLGRTVPTTILRHQVAPVA